MNGDDRRRFKTIQRNISGRNSQENFLERAHVKHGERYDYSRAIYSGLRNRVIIGCHKHGWFDQMAQAHIINGQGCPVCAKMARFGPRGPNGPRGPLGCDNFEKDQFLTLLTEEQRETYCYDLIPHGEILGIVSIICSHHGVFQIQATKHVNAKTRTGCVKCGKERQASANAERAKLNALSITDFLSRSILIHGSKYDYANVVYTKINNKVEIVCSTHGIFLQTPREHWAGSGCQKCANFATSNAEQNWLDSLGITHRQVRIKLPSGYVKVDGFDPDTNTVYEFLGDYWHGNPARYPSGHNTRCRKAFSVLYEETMARLARLQSEGYRVISIWESEWHDSN